MVDPVIAMLDNEIEEDPFILSLIKKKFELSLLPEKIIEDNFIYEDFLKSLNVDASGGNIFIGRHGYSGMGDFYSDTHGNTGMGFF